MDPNKQPGEKLTEKPCSILKNSKTPSQSARHSDYVPSPSTETLMKRVSFSTKKLVKKFDQHGALNSSCESSDMSSVSVNASVENLHPVSIFCNETNILTSDILQEQQSLKRFIDHSTDKENLKKCKLDLAEEDKENVACADMSMTSILPTSLHFETEPRSSNHQTMNEERTRLFCNNEMDMSFTIDIKSSNPVESENIAERLQQAIIEQDESIDMSMTSVNLQKDFQLSPRFEKELKLVPQCDLSLTKSADPSIEMNMSMTCQVPSTNISAFAKEIAETSGRNFVEFCQAAEPSLNQSEESCEVNMSLTYAVKPKHSPIEYEFLERISNNSSFGANMSETCAVVSNIRETFENRVNAEEITNIFQNINRVDLEQVEENYVHDQTFDANMSETCAVVSKIREALENEDIVTRSSQKESKEVNFEEDVGKNDATTQIFDANMSETRVVGMNKDNFVNEKVDVAETEHVQKRIRRASSEQRLSLSMDVSKKSLSNFNNFSVSCNVRTPSVLNNNMDGSFLQHLAQENRDLLTDDSVRNREALLSDEQLDDIEEPQTFMSGAESSTLRHSNNSSLSFDSSRIENYELIRKLKDELAPFQENVNDLANASALLGKIMREADRLLEMKSGTKNHGEPAEIDGIIETKPNTFEEMKNQVEEMSSREDIFWNVLQLTTKKLIVGFISNSLVLVLTWKANGEIGANDVSDVAIRSRLKADFNDVYVRIAHDFCLHNLKPEFLKVSYTRYEDVVEMINFVYEEVKSTMFMVNDLKVLRCTNITQIQRDRFTIEVNSENYDEYHKITIKIKPIEMIVPDDLKVERILGKAEEHKIRDNVKYVKKDKTFFKMLVHDIKAYLTIVSNN